MQKKGAWTGGSDSPRWLFVVYLKSPRQRGILGLIGPPSLEFAGGLTLAGTRTGVSPAGALGPWFPPPPSSDFTPSLRPAAFVTASLTHTGVEPFPWCIRPGRSQNVLCHCAEKEGGLGMPLESGTQAVSATRTFCLPGGWLQLGGGPWGPDASHQEMSATSSESFPSRCIVV